MREKEQKGLSHELITDITFIFYHSQPATSESCRTNCSLILIIFLSSSLFIPSFCYTGSLVDLLTIKKIKNKAWTIP
jgi:hypothetical protein